MTVLKVLLVICLILFLLSLVRVGGEAEYSTEGVWVRVKAGWFHFQVYPVKKKIEKKLPKKKNTAKKTEEKTEQDRPKQGGTLDLVKNLLPLVGEAAGALKRRICIDKLFLGLTLGGAKDAAGAAMGYGYSNLIIGMVWPVFEQNFQVKEYHIHTGVDFSAPGPAVYIRAAFSARISQLVSFAVIFGWKFLKVWRQTKDAKSMDKKG